MDMEELKSAITEDSQAFWDGKAKLDSTGLTSLQPSKAVGIAADKEILSAKALKDSSLFQMDLVSGNAQVKRSRVPMKIKPTSDIQILAPPPSGSVSSG